MEQKSLHFLQALTLSPEEDKDAKNNIADKLRRKKGFALISNSIMSLSSTLAFFFL